jgi:hypothetical protein
MIQERAKTATANITGNQTKNERSSEHRAIYSTREIDGANRVPEYTLSCDLTSTNIQYHSSPTLGEQLRHPVQFRQDITSEKSETKMPGVSAQEQSSTAIDYEDQCASALKPGVIQKMDIFSGIKHAAKQIFHTIPSPLEMSGYTSCVCFVFNSPSKTIDQVKDSGVLYKSVFSAVEKNWKSAHPKEPFIALCPFDENGKKTGEYSALLMSAVSGTLGARPLFVAVGHCSPGSSTISADDSAANYSTDDIVNLLPSVFQPGCTIYLTPCSTAVPGDGGEQSFQDQFIDTMMNLIDPTGDFITIGTNSTSVPNPILGNVLTTGHTYKKGKNPITEEDYWKTHPKKKQ